MKIEEALKLLDELRQHLPFVGLHKYMPCAQLGIEALKRVKSLRSFWGKDLNLKLPGETEE